MLTLNYYNFYLIMFVMYHYKIVVLIMDIYL